MPTPSIILKKQAFHDVIEYLSTILHSKFVSMRIEHTRAVCLHVNYVQLRAYYVLYVCTMIIDTEL